MDDRRPDRGGIAGRLHGPVVGASPSADDHPRYHVGGVATADPKKASISQAYRNFEHASPGLGLFLVLCLVGGGLATLHAP